MGDIAAGVDKENTLRAAGFNDTEIQQWKSDTAHDLLNAGFATNEIDQYFGQKNPDMSGLKAHFDQALAQPQNGSGAPAKNLDEFLKVNPDAKMSDVQNPFLYKTKHELDPNAPMREARSFNDAIEAGWQMSVEGLIKRGAKPNVVLPEDAPMFYRIASQVSGLAGDVPAMIAGSAAGAEVGAAAGGAIGTVVEPGGGTIVGAGAGAVVGGGYGSFALPAAIRKTLMDHYEKGDVKDFNDFWERAAATFIEANNQGMVGAATAGAGAAVGKVAGAVAPAIKTTAQLTTEVATMTTLGKAVEGQTPQPQDFIDAAILVGGMHGAGAVATKLRSSYAETGIHPSDLAQRALTDPLIKQDLLTQDQQIPDRIAKESGIQNRSGQPIGLLGSKEAIKSPPTVERSEAEKKILSQVGEKPADEATGYSVRSAYKDFVDKLDPINQAVKVLAEDPKTLSTDENPYQLARMANDYKSKVKFVMESGGLDYKTLAKTGKSFDEVIAPFKKNPEGFEAYLIAKRAVEVEGKGLTSGFDLEAANKVIKEGSAKYEKSAQDFYAFENQNLKYLKDSGVISEKEFSNMTEMNKAHVSFARILDEEKGGLPSGGGSKGPGSLKEFKGSDKKIQSPLLSTLENTQSIFKVAERNRAISALIDIANESKGQELLTLAKSPKAKLGDNQFEVFRDGERQVWETESKDLAQAIKSLGGDTSSTNIFMRFAKTISGIKRLSISLAPDFIVKNFFRDQLTAGSFSKGGAFPFFDAIVAMKDIVGKNENYYNWLKSGGAGGTFLELDKNYLEQNIFDLNKKTGLMDKAWNVIKTPVHFLEAAGAITEQATRLAEFKRVSKGESSGKNVFAGGFAAREVTVDFSRIGAKMSALNSITAFQNVSIQGLDRTVRAMKEDPVGVGIKAVAAITVPSVLLWWANKDDERYKQLPRWQKDTFWIIPTDKWEEAKQGEAEGLPEYLVRQNNGKTEINKGVIYRIPKPQELGILFGSLPERILDKYFTDDPNAMKQFDQTMQNLVTPSFVPDSISPFIEQKFNRSLFTDSKIVPGYLEGIAPEYQYTEYTSESAKQLAKMIKSMPGVGGNPNELSLSSPMVIDNYVRAWSGNLGMYTLRVADEALYKTGVAPEPVRPASTLADIPVIKAFVIRYPSASATSIQDFYDNYAIQKQKFDTIQHLGKTQDFEDLQKELEKIGNGDDVFLKLDGMKKALTTQSQLIRIINKNPDYTPDEKRQLIDGIYYGMIEISKGGNDILNSIDKANKELKKNKTNE